LHFFADDISAAVEVLGRLLGHKVVRFGLVAACR